MVHSTFNWPIGHTLREYSNSSGHRVKYNKWSKAQLTSTLPIRCYYKNLNVSCYCYRDYTSVYPITGLYLTNSIQDIYQGGISHFTLETYAYDYLLINSSDAQTLAETSVADFSFFFGCSWPFCTIALFGTKTMNMFLSLKLLFSSVASCEWHHNIRR